MRISDWSSDVCSSDLARLPEEGDIARIAPEGRDVALDPLERDDQVELPRIAAIGEARIEPREIEIAKRAQPVADGDHDDIAARREAGAIVDGVVDASGWIGAAAAVAHGRLRFRSPWAGGHGTGRGA